MDSNHCVAPGWVRNTYGSIRKRRCLVCDYGWSPYICSTSSSQVYMSLLLCEGDELYGLTEVEVDVLFLIGFLYL